MIQDNTDKAIKNENPSNTFSGIALFKEEIVGIHILRKFEELGLIGAHIANLWVNVNFRKIGIAKELKIRGENWAKKNNIQFLNTNVHPSNNLMIDMNKNKGFTQYKINMRKRL